MWKALSSMAWNSSPLNYKFPFIQPQLWSKSYLQSLRQRAKGVVGEGRGRRREEQWSLSSPAILSKAEPDPAVVLFCVSGVLRLDPVPPVVQLHHMLWGREKSYAIKLENVIEATKLRSRQRRRFNIRNYFSLFFKKATIRKKVSLDFFLLVP